MPPLNLIALALIGALLLRTYPSHGKRMIVASIVLLWICSMPAVGNFLLAWLEQDADTPISEMHGAQAIIILAGGRNYDVAEFGGDTTDKYTLERVRLGALIQRNTSLPILITGGKPDSDETSEAALMQKALTEFSASTNWMEQEAMNTAQNAVFSARMLAKHHVKDIILVTHGWHMPRARAAFERAGFQVAPSGAGRHKQGSYTILHFLPTAEGLYYTQIFMHEAIGIAWYWATNAGENRS